MNIYHELINGYSTEKKMISLGIQLFSKNHAYSVSGIV